jgi:uncharacterized protein (DUF1499 family)
MELFGSINLSSAGTARTYPVQVKELAGAVGEATRKLPRWTLIHADEEEIRAVCKSPVFGFSHDVTIHLTPRSVGAHTNTRADFRSTSRIAVWDLGQNRRNLEELLSTIDRKLTTNY